MDNIPLEQQPPKVYDWMPPEGYYEQIAQSNVNAPVNFIGRMAIGLYGFIRFGRSKIVTAPDFNEARDELKQGNVITVSIHRNGFDTVLLPNVLERIGLHHSRPMSKIELFQNRFSRWAMHKLGGFAVDKTPGKADLDGLRIAQAGILRRAELSEKKRSGLLRRKIRNGYETIYPEGTRVDTDVLNVLKIKPGASIAALENNSLIVPVAFAGLSTEKTGEKPNRVAVARDKRAWFGLGKRLVFSVGKPFRLDPVENWEKLSRGDKVKLIRAGDAMIKAALQAELENAIKVRGSSLEEEFPQPEL